MTMGLRAWGAEGREWQRDSGARCHHPGGRRASQGWVPAVDVEVGTGSDWGWVSFRGNTAGICSLSGRGMESRAKTWRLSPASCGLSRWSVCSHCKTHVLSLTCPGFPLILGAEFHFLVKPEQRFCLKQSCCAHLPSTFRSPLGGPQERPGDLRTDGARPSALERPGDLRTDRAGPSALEGVHPHRAFRSSREAADSRLLLLICVQ